jgi:hypothetical protein
VPPRQNRAQHRDSDILVRLLRIGGYRDDVHRLADLERLKLDVFLALKLLDKLDEGLVSWASPKDGSGSADSGG